jgi:hypothetical protein
MNYGYKVRKEDGCMFLESEREIPRELMPMLRRGAEVRRV